MNKVFVVNGYTVALESKQVHCLPDIFYTMWVVRTPQGGFINWRKTKSAAVKLAEKLPSVWGVQ